MAAPHDRWRQAALIADLQRSQQAPGQRLADLQGDARRLEAGRGRVPAAPGLCVCSRPRTYVGPELLEAVDGILQEQPDSGVFAAEQLALSGPAGCAARGRPCRHHLKPAALHGQVADLVALPVPVFDPTSPRRRIEDRLARRTRGERCHASERYVRSFQRGKVITPLLDEAEMQRAPHSAADPSRPSGRYCAQVRCTG